MAWVRPHSERAAEPKGERECWLPALCSNYWTPLPSYGIPILLLWESYWNFWAHDNFCVMPNQFSFSLLAPAWHCFNSMIIFLPVLFQKLPGSPGSAGRSGDIMVLPFPVSRKKKSLLYSASFHCGLSITPWVLLCEGLYHSVLK